MIKPTTTIGILLLLAGSTFAQEPLTRTDRTLVHSEDLIAAGQIEDALRILTRLRQEEKKDARIVFLMAQCEYNLWRRNRKETEHIGRAKKLLIDTFHLKRPYPEAAFFAGLMEADLENWVEAARAFRASIAGKFRISTSRKNLALMLYNHGVELSKKVKDSASFADEAVEIFTEARTRFEQLKNDMRNLPAERQNFRDFWLKSWSNLAAVHQAANSFAAAEKELRALMLVQPKNPFHYYNLGLIYGQRRETEEAIRWYRKALEVDKDFVESHLRLAYFASMDGESEKAEEHFRIFLKRFPTSWEGHFELGEHYKRKGEGDKAVAEFLLCVKIDPEAFVAMGKLAETFRRMGKIEKADEWQKKFARLEAESSKKNDPPQPDEGKEDKDEEKKDEAKKQ